MSIIAKEPASSYTPCPEGLFPGLCVDTVDLGIVETPYGAKHQVKIRWYVEVDDDDLGTRGHYLTKWYTLSLSEKANLRKDLELWRGRKFTPAELKNGFDIERLIDKPCQIQVIHKPADDGRVFARVAAVVAHNKLAPKLAIPVDYVREQDRPQDLTSSHPGVAVEKTKVANDDDDIPF